MIVGTGKFNIDLNIRPGLLYRADNNNNFVTDLNVN